MMPQQIDTAIKEMCTDAMTQAVAVLSEKYGFDAEEANRFLDMSTLKVVRKRGPAAPKDEKSPRTKKVEGDKPKRGKTGYLLYADDVRADVKSELTASLPENEKLKPQDVVRAIAAKWKGEDQSVRDEWNAKAKTPVTSDGESSDAEDKKVTEKATEKATVDKKATKKATEKATDKATEKATKKATEKDPDDALFSENNDSDDEDA